ncbi:MAG: DUF4358 domain-containing protein [Oscillospiraceae bacterium]|jgi:hypothetical protein|nr:DUF4358 domain-containing protein [Oscillospiraceae bacterium]
MKGKIQKVFFWAAAALLLCLFPGCSGRSGQEEVQSSSSSQGPDLSGEYYIDPPAMEKVLEEIYKDAPELLRDSITTPTETEIEEVLRLSPSNIDDAYIRYSSGSFGLADLYVIKPASDRLYELKRELEDLRLRRVEEFEQYDVYDALSIAQSAEVVEVGNYVVLLMMSDEEHAMELLKPIIPTGY